MAHGKINGVYFAECPHCFKTAKGKKEINVEFGYRTCDNQPQSWCRKCRHETTYVKKTKRG